MTKKLLKMKKNGREIDRMEPLLTVNRKLARPIDIREKPVIDGTIKAVVHALGSPPPCLERITHLIS